MLLEVKQPCARGETDAMSDIIGGKNHRVRHDSLYDIMDFMLMSRVIGGKTDAALQENS